MLRKKSGFTRRSFLQLSGMAVTAVSIPSIGFSKDQERKLHRPLNPQAFKSNLAGPILSLPTTFNEDLTVNHDAIHRMVDRALRYQVPIVELTAGNSKYACLK